MTLIHRLPGARLVLLVGVAALVAALALVAPAWWPEDILPGGGGDRSEIVRQAEMEHKLRAFTCRNKRKHRLAVAVLAGRVTLLDGAAYFRALDHQPPEFNWSHFRAHWPGDSDDERHCHEVIHWVYLAQGDSNPCLAAAMRARLRAELRAYLRRGPLCLREINELPPFVDGD
jgi:hypothetical protein